MYDKHRDNIPTRHIRAVNNTMDITINCIIAGAYIEDNGLTRIIYDMTVGG